MNIYGLTIERGIDTVERDIRDWLARGTPKVPAGEALVILAAIAKLESRLTELKRRLEEVIVTQRNERTGCTSRPSAG